MAYEDCGQGPAVVLVHGFGLCRQMWVSQVDFLATKGFRVIAPDLRGFGESETPGGPFTLAAVAEDIVELLNYLSIGRAAIGGMSMGGYILLDLLERYPQRIAGACFIATRCQSDNIREKASREKLAGMIRSSQSRTGVLDEFATLLFAAGRPTDHLEQIRKVRSWLASTDPRSLSEALLAMRDRKDYTSQIRNFTVPTLIVSGDQDQVIHPKHSRFLAENLPRSTHKIISGAGHMANIEQPVEFNKYLFEFLSVECHELVALNTLMLSS